MLFRERMRQTSWVLDHLDDLDADFLAVYRIDLHDCDITAPRFLSLAFRCFAYRGVMREELLAEQHSNEGHGPSPTSGPPSRQAPANDDDGAEWVSPDEMKAMFPDLCG